MAGVLIIAALLMTFSQLCFISGRRPWVDELAPEHLSAGTWSFHSRAANPALIWRRFRRPVTLVETGGTGSTDLAGATNTKLCVKLHQVDCLLHVLPHLPAI